MPPQQNNPNTSSNDPLSPPVEVGEPTLPQPPISPRKHSPRLILWTLLICLAALLLVAINRQTIQDWIRLHGYQAPASVAQLGDQDTMTSTGRKLLYINKPDIADKAVFSQNCLNKDAEQTIVLGCYHSVENGIFLLHVTDPRLSGVEQVTAAHEMLHAAYDRLSNSERTKVDAMLMDYYNHDLKDPRIKNEIALYKKTEPNDVVNEMHSVFGTEVANLPVGLEQYYSRYFTNRAVVVNFANNYQAAFTSRQAEVAQDDSQLQGLKSQIGSDEADLKAKLTVINTQTQSLRVLRVTDQAGYNAAVLGYNQLVDQYNNEVATVKTLVSQYNQLVTDRNNIALQEQQLSNALNANVQQVNQ